jgi:hypothetical protein
LCDRFFTAGRPRDIEGKSACSSSGNPPESPALRNRHLPLFLPRGFIASLVDPLVAAVKVIFHLSDVEAQLSVATIH